MSFIKDTDGTINGNEHNSIEGNQLPLSALSKGPFAPCSFGQDIALLNANSCDEEGNPQIVNETTSQLDGNDLHALGLANEYECIMNRAAEISVRMADYYSCHGEISGIGLWSGVEVMQKTATAIAEKISQIYSADYEDGTIFNIEATSM